MDQGVLVESGRHLIKLLEDAGIPPRAVLWVHSIDTDTGSDGAWRLWIVPYSSIADKHQFYRRLSELLAQEDIGLSASDTEFVPDKHRVIQALARIYKVTGDGSVHTSNNLLNGFFLPDAIILRLDL